MLRIPRPLYHDPRRRRGFREHPRRKIVQGGQHELFELLLQGDTIPALEKGAAVYPKASATRRLAVAGYLLRRC